MPPARCVAGFPDRIGTQRGDRGDLLAASAGSTEATTVTIVPTARQMAMVCHPTTRLAPVVWAPGLDRALRNTAAAARPSPRPTAEAKKPSAAASPSTEASTWVRDAPRQRTNASSCRRWATMMLMMLKMTSAPTKSAMASTTSSTVVNFGAPTLAMYAMTASNWRPVLTKYPGPIAWLTRPTTTEGATRGAADPRTTL